MIIEAMSQQESRAENNAWYVSVMSVNAVAATPSSQCEVSEVVAECQ